MITVYYPDGRIDYLNERKPTLERLQELVGGYIELISPRMHPLTGKHVVINEEGLLYDLPPNPTATKMLGYPQMLVGNVVVCEEDDIE
jgi:hypothetical protein